MMFTLYKFEFCFSFQTFLEHKICGILLYLIEIGHVWEPFFSIPGTYFAMVTFSSFDILFL